MPGLQTAGTTLSPFVAADPTKKKSILMPSLPKQFLAAETES